MNQQSFDFLGLFLSIALLAVFGYLWNHQVERMERAAVEGYTWAMVAGGVAAVVTVAGFRIGWDNVLFLFLCFTAAGAPMAWGEIRRHHFKLRHLWETLGLTHEPHQPDEAKAAGQPGAPIDRRD